MTEAITYNVQQTEVDRTGTDPKIVTNILFTGSYDDCKLHLVEEYGQLPLCVFLALDITIEAVQS